MQSQQAPAPLDALTQRLDALARDVEWLVERQRRQDELFDEITPTARRAFARELARIGRRIVASYSLEDVRALGDGITSILDTVRDLTQPTVLTIVDEASRTLQRADGVEPLGIRGMLRAARSEDVQKGFAVVIDVLRHVGLAARAVANFRAADSPSSRARSRTMLE